MFPAVSGHAVQNSKQQKKMDKIFKIKKMAEIQDGRYSSVLYKKKCLDAPCTSTTRRKHALSD